MHANPSIDYHLINVLISPKRTCLNQGKNNLYQAKHKNQDIYIEFRDPKILMPS